MKKPFISVLSMVLILSFTACPLPTDDAQIKPGDGNEIDDEHDSPPEGGNEPLSLSVRISDGSPAPGSLNVFSVGSLEEGTNPAEYEIWLFPTQRGNDSPIAQWNVNNITEYPPNDDGEFVIPVNALPNTTFVLLVMDVSTTPPNPVGIVGLTVDDHTQILELPPGHEFTGTLDFGNVVFHDTDIGVSSLTAAQNEGAFSPEQFSRLTELAEFSNAIRMVFNLIRNIDRNTPDQYYTEGVSLDVSLDELKSSLSEYTSSSEIPFRRMGINIYSHDSETEMQLFYPDGTVIHDDFRFFNQGTQSAAKWFTVLSLEDFNDHAVPGALWPLKNSSGEILAEFDLSVSIVRDQTGTPMVPIPFLEYQFDGEGDMVESIVMKWQYFASDGETPQTIADLALLEYMIDPNTTHFQNGVPTTYGFDRCCWGNGAGSFSGDLFEAFVDGPDLFQSDLISQIGYRFALYRISLE